MAQGRAGAGKETLGAGEPPAQALGMPGVPAAPAFCQPDEPHRGQPQSGFSSMPLPVLLCQAGDGCLLPLPQGWGDLPPTSSPATAPSQPSLPKPAPAEPLQDTSCGREGWASSPLTVTDISIHPRLCQEKLPSLSVCILTASTPGNEFPN